MFGLSELAIILIVVIAVIAVKKGPEAAADYKACIQLNTDADLAKLAQKRLQTLK